MDGAVGENIFVVGDEVGLLPNVAEEAVEVALTYVVGPIQPVRKWAT